MYTHFIKLLIELFKTESPAQKQLLVLSFLLEFGERSDLELGLIQLMKEKVEAKKNQGLMTQVVVEQQKQRRSYPHPKFFPTSKAKGICATCKDPINGGPLFMHRHPIGVNLYCVFEACFPEKHRVVMLTDRAYVKFINSLKE